MFKKPLIVLCTTVLLMIAAESRLSASAQTVTRRNIYISLAGCQLSGSMGIFWDFWNAFTCEPRTFPEDGDDHVWYQLITTP